MTAMLEQAPPKRGLFLGAGIVLAMLVALVTLIMLTQPDTNYTPMSVRNPDPVGAMALATVAQEQGLRIDEISYLRDARIADPENTTLVIVSAPYLLQEQVDSILDYPGPVLVLGSRDALLATLDQTLYVGSGAQGIRSANCTDPDAEAAGTISSDGPAFFGDAPGSTFSCFDSWGGATLMRIMRGNAAPVTLLADPTILDNSHIALEGNAALALRLVGHEPRAVWYVGSDFDSTQLTWLEPVEGVSPTFEIEPTLDVFPAGTGSALYALGVAVVVIALWRARRFGPLVREPLPVIIRSSEATRGRARLYRRARSTGRAAAALRAAAAVRMGRRVGVGRTHGRDALLLALARATGQPISQIEPLLYGPPPATEAELMTLIHAIDNLEGEVHRS